MAEFVVDAVLLSLSILMGGMSIDRPPREHLKQKAEAKRRAKALPRWIEQTGGIGPIPEVGLKCVQCEFDLTGLVDRRCPECGKDFDLTHMGH